MAGKKSTDDIIDWFTISYRTIYAAAAVVALGVAVGLWLYYGHGTALPSPPPETPSPSSTAARFIAIEGSVKVKPVGSPEWIAADKSMVLRKNDLVKTGPSSTGEVEFFDGTVVHVRPDSLITIEETKEDPSTKQRKVAWHISSGEVQFNTARRNVAGSSVEASTPTARTVADEQTRGGIRVAETGESDVKVFKGRSVIETRGGQRNELASGEGLKVDAVGKAGAKITLPEKPALLAPKGQAEISYPDPGRATTMLVWGAVQGATSYRVMLDYSPYFNRPLVDNKSAAPTLQVTGLDAGKYYWRVASIGKEGAEGDFSDYERFSITRQERTHSAAPPPLTIDSLDVKSNMFQIKGRTEPGATVTVNGHEVDVQEDGSFNEFIPVDKPGKHIVTVRSIGTNGGVTEQQRTITVGAF